MSELDPIFHAGEREIQEKLGVREVVARVGPRMVRDFLLEQHRTFFAQLPFVVLGARDEDKRPWATLLVGPPGFAHAPDDKHLHVAAELFRDDVLSCGLHADCDVGLLGIELSTRRRNRANGVLLRRGSGGLRIRVQQSYGNCPQFITPRAVRFVSPGASGRAPREASGGAARRASSRIEMCSGNPLQEASGTRRLGPDARGLIASADTLFIASAYGASSARPSHGVDVSHRGGPAGFVRLADDDLTLLVPDYSGNNMFNTLGNLERCPQAGLLFVDFEGGRLLQLTGTTTLVWEPRPGEFPGATRGIRFHPVAGNWIDGVPLELVPERP